MANVPAALRDLPLEHIIGAPLEAAIKAEAHAAITAVKFIEEVCLTSIPQAEAAQTQADLEPPGISVIPLKGDDVPAGDDTQAYEARYVEFKFDRLIEEQVLPPAGSPPGTPPTLRHT